MPILLGLKADRVRLCQEVAVAVPTHLDVSMVMVVMMVIVMMMAAMVN